MTSNRARVRSTVAPSLEPLYNKQYIIIYHQQLIFNGGKGASRDQWHQNTELTVACARPSPDSDDVSERDREGGKVAYAIEATLVIV